MKKTELFKLAGGKRQAVYLLGISTQAVAKWGDDVPELRVFQLKVLRPQWFESLKKPAPIAMEVVAVDSSQVE
jgi:hypothetical protein